MPPIASPTRQQPPTARPRAQVQDYPLPEVTERLVAGLSDVVRLDVYISHRVLAFEKTPLRLDEIVASFSDHAIDDQDPLAGFFRTSRRLLRAAHRLARSPKVKVRIIDTRTAPEDATRVGIAQMSVQVQTDESFERILVRLGFAISFADRQVVVPAIHEEQTVDYLLASRLHRVAPKKPPRLGLITDTSNPAVAQAFSKAAEAAGGDSIQLTNPISIPDDITALAVLGPEKPFSAEEERLFMAHLSRGTPAAFLLDTIAVDSEKMVAQPAKHGLDNLLAAMGVSLGDGLVMDPQCGQILKTQILGHMRMNVPVKYPYLIRPSVVYEGIFPQEVKFLFAAPLSDARQSAQVLVRSSQLSTVAQPPFNISPQQQYEPTGQPRSYPLAISTMYPGPRPALVLVSSTSRVVRPLWSDAEPDQETVAGIVGWLFEGDLPELMALRPKR